MNIKLIIFVFVIVLLSSSVSADYISALVADWRLEENAANTFVEDTKDGNYNLTASLNTENFSVVGKNNNSFFFNRTTGKPVHYVEAPTNFSNHTVGTINCWFKAKASDLSAGGGDRIFSYYADINNRINLGVNSNGQITMYVLIGGATKVADSERGAFNDDVWNMVTLLQNGTDFVLYHNGTMIFNDTQNYWFDDLGNGTFNLGVYVGDHVSSSFWGYIDECTVYNEAVSQVDISTLYDKGTGTFTPFTDITPPTITINNPTNNTNLPSGTKSTWINITTDENANCSYNLTDTGYINMTLFTNTNALTHSFNFTNSSSLNDGNTYNLYYRCQDSSGNNNTVSAYHTFGVTKDTTLPTAEGLSNNASTTTKVNENVNWTVVLSDETALDTYTFAWNDTGTMTNDTVVDISGLSYTPNITKTVTATQGNYICGRFHYNDTSGNSNVTVDSCFTVANTVTTTPTLISPTNLSSTANNYALLNWTNSTDPDNATQTITYYVQNSTDNIIFSLLFNGTSTTYNWTTLADGSYYWKVKAGDGVDNSSNSSTRKFTVSTTAPAITLEYPTNDYWFDTKNISFFNFTATDIDGLGTCNLWHNLTGIWHENQSTTTATSGTMFSFNQTDNLTDENYYVWNVNCSDTSGNANFYVYNFTFYIDTINPNISLTQPTGTKSSRTSIQADWTVSDYSLNSCWYNVYRGINLEVANTSVTCSDNTTTFNVTLDASFTFNFYANDNVGNVGSDSSSFTVDTSAPPPSNGGGGGAIVVIPEEQCTVDEDCKVFGEKYYCIQNYCIYKEIEPVCNYNGICEPERGEHYFNCGDEWINVTTMIEGDCHPLQIRDAFKIAIHSQIFLWIMFITVIVLIVYLTQVDPESYVRRTYRRYRKKYFRRR